MILSASLFSPIILRVCCKTSHDGGAEISPHNHASNIFILHLSIWPSALCFISDKVWEGSSSRRPSLNQSVRSFRTTLTSGRSPMAAGNYHFYY